MWYRLGQNFNFGSSPNIMSEKSLREAVDSKGAHASLDMVSKILCTMHSCSLKVWVNIICGLEISGSDPVAVHIISDMGHVNVSH